MAIGVPAHRPSPQMGPAPFNPDLYGQRFGGLARGPGGALESASSTSTPQVRPIQGNQGIGVRGPMGTGPPMRASGIAMQHQQRPVQSSVRPQTTLSNQPSTSQSLQGHGMPRGPAVGPPASSSPATSQGLQTHNQPWLSSSGVASRPSLPNAPFRAQMNHPQTLQQRSHIPQQLRPQIQQMPSQRPQMPSSSSSDGILESHRQQIPTSQVSQQLIPKSAGIGNQKLVANLGSQPNIALTGVPDKTASTEVVETCNRVISKRSIQELVAQIDPTERLDPAVEDILVDIAEDFVESITTSACSLAKHRKSTTLEAKDILLHLDRNWNMTLPGFMGDEIKCYKKPSVNDIHKERLAAIRKSVATAEVVKSSAGQAAGSAKGHITKPDVAQP